MIVKRRMTGVEIVAWARSQADLPEALRLAGAEMAAAVAAYHQAQIPYRLGGIDRKTKQRKRYYDTRTPEGARVAKAGKLLGELEYEARRRAHIATFGGA